MDKNFESKFSALQADMVSICLEYCEQKATTIFIHVICEKDSVFANFFFRMNGALYRKALLGNNIGTVSLLRQKEALSIVTKSVWALVKLCKEENNPVPTEIKLIYDVQTGHLDANYGYSSVITDNKSARDITETWFSSYV
ncbi:MAG: hypothetical protein FWF10_09655 [Clostridiales bacterium]|nr:hypothetical protein [Clostridiales bacterium]